MSTRLGLRVRVRVRVRVWVRVELTEPAKYEAPCTPDEETRLSVASMVSLTCAFQLCPALSVV